MTPGWCFGLIIDATHHTLTDTSYETKGDVMKKANRRRDILLQTKRERQRLRKQTKPDHERGASDIREDKIGFNIFAYFSRKLPRLRRDIDKRDRQRIAQKRGNR